MKKNLGPRLGLYPTPVVVVGTYDDSVKPNLVTLAWAGVCCSEPPSVQISIRKSRHSHAAIAARKVFSVNVPSAGHVRETDYAGIVSGRDHDKFEAANLTPVKGEVLDVPLVKEFPVSMECVLTHTLPLGSHDLFVGRIEACWIEESVLGGRDVDAKKLDPLAFMLGGEYYALGSFAAPAFSVGKELIVK
jgi:flavin reductase (DIM6/NTAB) family NADH-FMN oxidoreductase RutF